MSEWVNDGVLAPGNSLSTFQIDGDFRNRKVLEIELGGSESGVNYDLLRVGRKAYFSGALNIKFVNDFVPQNRERFIIVRHGSSEGRFESITVPRGYQLSLIRYGLNEVVITLERATVLTIDLTHFSAKKTASNVQVYWSTTIETNSKEVNIQHAIDGKTWRNIGFVESVGKASDYVFNHVEPKNMNYYRLEQEKQRKY